MIIRIRIIAICLIFSGAALAALFCSGRLVMNTTYSVPVGLWWRVDETLQCGDTVRVPIAAFKSTGWMPERYWRKNGWGESRDFLKHVAGLSGDLVEPDSSGLLRVAGKVIANSAPLSFDKAGRPLSTFPLPVRLASDEVWLLSDSPRGFDSRYLGPAKREQCHKVKPILTWSKR